MATGDRIEGLTVWRAVLMLGGMATHATFMREDVAGLALIANVSHAFRMGAFFAISGLLSGAALRRRPSPEAWLGDRLVRLGIPTLFGIAAVSPVVGLGIRQFPKSAGLPAPILFDWYHLWFLVALLIYSVVAAQMQRHGWTDRLVERLDALIESGQAPMRILVGVGALSLFAILAGTAMVDALVLSRYAPPLIELRLILGYLPVFVLGLAIGRSDPLRAALLGSPHAPAVLLAAFLAAYALWYLGADRSPFGLRHAWLGDLLGLLGAAFCPPAAAALILRSAIAIRRVPAPMRALADASFTMYILHFPIAIETTALLASTDWNPWVDFALVLSASASLSYAVHRLVVRRSSVAALLLNGRRPRPLATRGASFATTAAAGA